MEDILTMFTSSAVSESDLRPEDWRSWTCCFCFMIFPLSPGDFMRCCLSLMTTFPMMSVRLLGLILPALREIPDEEWSKRDFFSSSSDFNEYDF